VHESVEISKLVEDAIKMNDSSLMRHHVTLTRRYGDAPPIVTDKHKVMQILVNLIKNAKHAVSAAQGDDRWIDVRIDRGSDNTVRVEVSDNGVGISPENLQKIFMHGFTTKKDGHGFGLHSGALSARELGGSLQVQSAGLGQGATFTLELPIEIKPKSAPPVDLGLAAEAFSPTAGATL
jgi:C4-dicarboxylate-specific signal transduction histidine kinase